LTSSDKIIAPRRQEVLVAVRAQPSERFFRFAAFEVDLWTGELRKNGTKLKVQEQPLKVLAMLLARSGELVTREQLREGLWSNDTFVDFDRGLNTAVNRLRAALNDSAENPRFVETVGRRGYRFIASVKNYRPGEPRTALKQSAPAERVYEWPDDKIGSSTPSVEDGETSRTAIPIASRRAPAANGNGRESESLAEAIPAPCEQHPEQLRGSTEKNSALRWKVVASFCALLTAVLMASAVRYRLHQAKPLTDKDTIVLDDFTNTTGDTVFDGTLRLGLSVQLEQSPFLSLVSEEQVQQTLRMMGQPRDARLTPEIAREVCQRTAGAAVLDGSIAQIGGQYNVILKAVNCATGTILASAEASAGDKSHVLRALGEVASEMRNKLGESLSTVQKYDTPVWQATTPSLEALQAFSLAQKTLLETNDNAQALDLAQRAVELDPNFALAYAVMSEWYWNLGETTRSAETGRRAFELRKGVSENERLIIEGNYYLTVTGDLIEARKIFEIGARTFPREPFFPGLLGPVSFCLGQYDRSLGESLEGLRLFPRSAVAYGNVILAYLSLNRIKEAEAAAEEAHTKGLDSPDDLYTLAFFRKDIAEMAKQVDSAAGKPGEEDSFLAREADTAAYFGHLGRARELSRRAIEAAHLAKRREISSTYAAASALREAVFGNSTEARRRAMFALTRSSGRDMKYGAVLALAYAGNKERAHAFADELDKRFPEDTIVQFNYLPTLRAKLEVSQNRAERAQEILRAARPYELGAPATNNWTTLYPVYVRGEAYLAAHQGGEASTEFQRILDQPGIVLNEPIGALARLQLGRAYAMSGDKAKARSAYEDFFALWKDADPDIPILKQAKEEYAKL
jgi:DNA-binding winged helix-turn-helix (wHTH) protein/tetratricopeptide (TPR) repeat protein